MTEPTLDDLSNCPDPGACEICGVGDPPAALADTRVMETAWTELGIFCLTRCARCARAGTIPELTLRQIAERVEGHRRHTSRET